MATLLATVTRLALRLGIIFGFSSIVDYAFGTAIISSASGLIEFPMWLGGEMFTGENAAGRLTAFFTAMAVAASIVLGAVQVYQSNKVARATKTIDVVMHAAVRYNDLLRNRPDSSALRKNRPTPLKLGRAIHTWHSTYWGLKNDQFDYWLMGFFDHDTFCDWSSSIHKYFWENIRDLDLTSHPSLLVGKIDYKTVVDSYTGSWMRYRNGASGAVNPSFVGFVDALARNVRRYWVIIDEWTTKNPEDPELENRIRKVWDLLFAELIGVIYLRYIDKPGFFLKVWNTYSEAERKVLGWLGIDDLFGLILRSGLGDRWRRDTIRGMTWARYTQSLQETTQFRRNPYRGLMRGERDESAIQAELFGAAG